MVATQVSDGSLAPPNELLERWRRFRGLPGGAGLFSRVLSVLVPYAGSIRPRVTRLERGRAEAALVQHRGVMNHLGSIHALAAANLGELAGNLALQTLQPRGGRWIVPGLSIDYLKKARGRLVAVCVLDDALDWSVAQDVEGLVEVTDAEGDVVVVVRPRWRIGPKPPRTNG